MDEAMSLISLSISEGLQFHIDENSSPQEIWDKFNDLFGTVNEFRALYIKDDLTPLVLDAFPFIEDFLMKFKQQRNLLEGCGKVKIENECIYMILSKLQGNFQIFSYTFHSIMDTLGPRFTMPTFEVFCDHLDREQSNLTQLDFLKGSKNQVLVSQTSTTKPKKKPKPRTDSAGSESSSKPTPKLDAKKPSSKGKYSKSGESTSKTKYIGDRCSFCGKEEHPISRCWKCLEALEAMQQYIITSLKPPPTPTRKGHALFA